MELNRVFKEINRLRDSCLWARSRPAKLLFCVFSVENRQLYYYGLVFAFIFAHEDKDCVSNRYGMPQAFDWDLEPYVA